MDNEEFKRVWEKEGRRLFAIEERRAAEPPKKVTKSVQDTKIIVKAGRKYPLPQKPKHGDFRDM